MGTPSLWVTIDVDLSETQPRDITKITKILSLSLRRSANYPLMIHQTADIYISEFAFAYLSAAKGNLPLLERLKISGASLSLLDTFEDAPKLTRVSFSELGAGLLELSWSQLHRVTYSHVWSVDNVDNLCDGLQVMCRCPNGCQFSIFDLDIADLTLSLLPVHSNVSHFELALADASGSAHSGQALGEILATLTLPNLQRLSLEGIIDIHPLVFLPPVMTLWWNVFPKCEPSWSCISKMSPQVFEAAQIICSSQRASSRNSFGRPIKLASPRTLSVSASSLFTFNDHVLWDFVASRSAPSRDEPFELSMWYPTPDERDIDIVVAARMSELEERGLLIWSFCPV
ncbi:hypothetical protein FB451DRAFT_1177871 [Mycena latifolia]|nr:hypothetical protein FB451DRAFT_1177871 [Mycena latifolia]